MTGVAGAGSRRRGGARLAAMRPPRGRVEQRELQLEAQAARTQARRVDGAQPVGGGDQRALRRRSRRSGPPAGDPGWRRRPGRGTRAGRGRGPRARRAGAMPAAASPAASAVTNPSTVSASARPSSSRTASASTRPPVEASSWSRIDSASRMPPAARRATSATASGSASPPVRRQDPLELAADLGDGQPPHVEPLEPRQDRRRELLRMGRGEHERDELGRLLERLEERVPGVPRDLVRLVEDVDLALEVGRRVGEPLAQLPHRLDAAVGRRVDLDQVERPALADRDARRRTGRRGPRWAAGPCS